MKRLALCLALLASSGCAMTDEFFFEETRYDAAPEHASGCGLPAAPGTRIVPTPVGAPAGIAPAGGVVPPPPPLPPQTREPDLVR
jgi:hypothetical protein